MANIKSQIIEVSVRIMAGEKVVEEWRSVPAAIAYDTDTEAVFLKNIPCGPMTSLDMIGIRMMSPYEIDERKLEKEREEKLLRMKKASEAKHMKELERKMWRNQMRHKINRKLGDGKRWLLGFIGIQEKEKRQVWLIEFRKGNPGSWHYCKIFAGYKTRKDILRECKTLSDTMAGDEFRVRRGTLRLVPLQKSEKN